MWVGRYISKEMSLGATTTNRVEGMHGDMKRNLKSSNGLFLSFQTIDRFYNIKVYFDSLV